MSQENGQGAEDVQDAQAVTRELRSQVAEQLHDLVLEREGLGALDEIVARVQRVGAVWQEVKQARARQLQAEEHGLPKAKHVQAERDALDLLRATVMSLGEACGSVVVGLDFELRRPRVESRA